MDAHPLVIARALAVLGALACAPACPTPEGDEAGGGAGGATAGGEGGGAATTDAAPFPESPLDPWAGSLLVQARARAGEAGGASDGPRARVAALVVRADLAFRGSEGVLHWVRASFVLGPFGLRVFELAPRGIDDPEHGEVPGTPASQAVARAAAADVPPLADPDCAALPEPVCEALLALDRTVPPEATGPARPARVAIASVGAILVTGEGEIVLVDLTASRSDATSP